MENIIREVERICNTNSKFIDDMTLTQYLKITYILYMDGQLNMGRVLVLYHFTKLVFRRKRVLSNMWNYFLSLFLKIAQYRIP